MEKNTTNPLQTDGFEFVEFTAPNRAGIEQLHQLFGLLGFSAVARHAQQERRDPVLGQGDINFLVNGTPYTHFAQFAQAHGPSACAMGWRVKDAAKAYAHAVAQGAVPFDTKPGFMELNLPAGRHGIGNSVLYFIDRYGDKTIYDVDFVPIEGADQHPQGVGLKLLDHLTHNVEKGNMDVWSGFYERIANFREIRYFDIEGKQTGLVSRALTSPCGKLRIPINESADDKSQIAEFIRTAHACTAARGRSSIWRWAPTTSTPRCRPCATAAWCSWIRRKPITRRSKAACRATRRAWRGCANCAC